MSDSRLRELERRWTETGSVEDEVSYLREQIRVGGLEQEMLELAAHLGSPAAIAIVGEYETSHRDDLALWIYYLRSWEKQVSVRATIVCAELVSSILEARIPNHQMALMIAKTWVRDPSSGISTLAPNAGATLDEFSRSLGSGLAATDAAQVHAHTAWAVSAKDEHAAALQASLAASEAKRALPEDINIRQAIQEQLIPWALGYYDPLRERVEALTTSPTG